MNNTKDKERYEYEVHPDTFIKSQAYIFKPGKDNLDFYLTISGHVLFELEFAKDLCAALNLGRQERFNHEK